MSVLKVATQEEFDQALADKNVEQIVCTSGRFNLLDGTAIEIELRGSSRLLMNRRGEASVSAFGTSYVRAINYSTIEACDRCEVQAHDDCRVVARNRSYIEAHGRSRIAAWNNSTVKAYGFCSIEAFDTSTIEARGNCKVHAYSESVINADMEPNGSGEIFAQDRAFVRLRHCRSIKATSDVIIAKSFKVKTQCEVSGGRLVVLGK